MVGSIFREIGAFKTVFLLGCMERSASRCLLKKQRHDFVKACPRRIASSYKTFMLISRLLNKPNAHQSVAFVQRLMVWMRLQPSPVWYCLV